MNIYSHAVANYVERVLNHDPQHVGSDVKEFVREQIRKTVIDPDRIHLRENDEDDDDRDCPIYIRGDVAVPLDWEDGEPFVPTTYPSDRFPKEDNTYNDPAKAEG